MYHRIARRAIDPLRMSVSPENFADQVAAIRLVADVVPPGSILLPGSRPRVALTFDDGYADNLHHAVPVLAASDTPACIFATNHFEPEAPEFWWDQLDHLFLCGEVDVPFVDLLLDVGSVRFDVRTEAGRIRTFSRLNVVFRNLPAAERQAHVDALHHQLGRTPVRCGAHLRLTAMELAELDGGGLIEIGGHTVTHAALPLVDPHTAGTEIADNRRALAAICGRSPQLFAYPYGYHVRRTTAEVRAAGYDMAFGARSGTIGMVNNPYRVPRFAVSDCSAGELTEQLLEVLG